MMVIEPRRAPFAAPPNRSIRKRHFNVLLRAIHSFVKRTASPKKRPMSLLLCSTGPGHTADLRELAGCGSTKGVSRCLSAGREIALTTAVLWSASKGELHWPIQATTS